MYDKQEIVYVAYHGTSANDLESLDAFWLE